MSGKNLQQDRTGSAIYGKNVILSIITLATKEITGVVSLQGRGVKIDIDEDNNIFVDVFIKILYGHSVADVAFRVQENIKRSVETMSVYRVKNINVNVLEVGFEEEV
ncbi:MAG TPA: Asp23/Gls24 family envelope stress response protein [Clostridiales bacterium]|nr:Asp23/Gls24 family envelope stress response protein [Clostridiales bacterium]